MRRNVTMVLRQTRMSVAAGAGLGVAALTTAVCKVLANRPLPDVVMLYLLGVVLVAIRFGYAASLIAAALSVAALDFFFTEPYLSFAVTDKRYYLTFAIMAFVAFVICNLMQRIRGGALAIREREARTARLYAMSREVSIAGSPADILRVACRHIHDTFSSDVSVLLPDRDGSLRRAEPPPSASLEPLSQATLDGALGLMAQGARSFPGPPPRVRTPRGEDMVPLDTSRGALGVLVIRPRGEDRLASPANRELLETYASQIALAIERAELVDNGQRAQIEFQKERLRNALLSSVSHDLRTPLAVVKGAVTALLDTSTNLSTSRRQEYLEAISHEANRLDRLVRNLLSMTSLEAGALRARKEWQPLEEVVGVALNRLDEQLGNRTLRVAIDANANLVPFDATLIEQVFLNLVENAARYTPASAPIEIRARRVDGGTEVEILDGGSGVPHGQEEAIFEKFHRADSEVPRGMGLGLTICRGIIVVHGGTIWCENRPEGGAAFRFLLPYDADAPTMNGLPEPVGGE